VTRKSAKIRPFGDEHTPRASVEVKTKDGRQLFAVCRRGVLGALVYIGEDGKPIDGVTLWRERVWGELIGAGP